MQKNPRDPGEYNVKLTIEAATPSNANSGQQTKTWATAFQRWGKVEPNNGGEKFQQHQIQGNVTHIVSMNSDSDTRGITNQHRLTFSGRTLGILAAYDAETDFREVILHCEEVK